MLDVVIVGGGPAGLSAALVLGRCRRDVLVIDEGRPRNAASRASHGFLTRDGIDPLELLRIAREQLEPYAVKILKSRALEAWREGLVFAVRVHDGSVVRGRRLVLATGVVDVLPELPGFDELYGRSVFHCPYCDGWEVRDHALAALAPGDAGAELALGLTTWSRDVVLFTGGGAAPNDAEQGRLAQARIPVHEAPVLRLEGEDGALAAVHLEGGARVARQALFFSEGRQVRTDLATSLGCEIDDTLGVLRTSPREETGVPGVYVAGDASADVLFAIVAAADGARAAHAINVSLRREDEALGRIC